MEHSDTCQPPEGIIVEEELKPCPFCGGKVELRLSSVFVSDLIDEFWSIHCKCSMGSPDALYDKDKKSNIINDWNTRDGCGREVCSKKELFILSKRSADNYDNIENFGLELCDLCFRDVLHYCKGGKGGSTQIIKPGDSY